VDENLSLADVFTRAAADYFAGQDDPGMLNGFVVVAEVIRSSGETQLVVTRPETQGYAQTLGLVGVADMSARDDVTAAFYAGEAEG
jgi:hypothetical protein